MRLFGVALLISFGWEMAQGAATMSTLQICGCGPKAGRDREDCCPFWRRPAKRGMMCARWV